MHIYTLRSQMLTECSLQETFEIFNNPYNLAKITPPWLNFKVVSEGLQMRKGAEIEYDIRWMGLPMYWKSLISEYEPPFLFVDEQVKGPYSIWKHRHTFEATPAGTKVGDEVKYALPLGFLGTLTHAVMVKKQLTAIFNFRQQALREMLGGKTVQVTEVEIEG
jgi:ligand-binding SRPBCC domain-containing protein